MPDSDSSRPSETVFDTQELLEIILLKLFDDLEAQDEGGVRVQRTRQNARTLRDIVGLQRVDRRFSSTIRISTVLRRKLFLGPDHSPRRSWHYEVSSDLPQALQPFYRRSILGASPLFNPLIQTELSDFPFRLWNLPSSASGNKHCAFMIVSKDNLVQFRRKHANPDCPTIVSSMLLSQPPCIALRCIIFEDRDETRDYVGRTTELRDPLIVCESGLKLGDVCAHLSRMFDLHKDVARVRLMTV